LLTHAGSTGPGVWLEFNAQFLDSKTST
jgi:hypothetical protein